jgi:hypothetical protein
MSDRAARRRAAREKDWVGHDPETHQSLDPMARLYRHTSSCVRCSTGTVASKGCPWLAEFAAKNPEVIMQIMGVMDGDGAVAPDADV